MQRISAVCSVYQLYAEYISCMQRISAVCSAYQLCAACISCMQRISAVCSVYQLYAAQISCMQRMSAVCSVYQLYAASINCMQRISRFRGFKWFLRDLNIISSYNWINSLKNSLMLKIYRCKSDIVLFVLRVT